LERSDPPCGFGEDELLMDQLLIVRVEGWFAPQEPPLPTT